MLAHGAARPAASRCVAVRRLAGKYWPTVDESVYGTSVDPPRSRAAIVPPLWRESRIGLEWAALRRSDVLRGAGVPAGDGRGVLLIPGFMAGDGSLGTMTQWLRAAGWHTKRAGIRANVACSEVACTRLEERLEALAERTGGRA